MRTLILTFATLFCLQLYSQEVMFFDNGCNYNDDSLGGLVELLGESSKADSIVEEIINAIPEYRNQPRNFVLREASVANARAATRNGQRYILFNAEFLEDFEDNALTKWAAYSLFAHEVGHHVLGHDLSSTNDAQRKEWELEADHYSGRVLAHLEATQHEVLAGIRNFDIDGESATHPAPVDRENKINEGYIQGLDERPSDHTKFNLPLDDISMRQNRWNLVTEQEAEIDDEKIKANFVFDHYKRYQSLRVCLLSNNSDVAPEARTIGSIHGTGPRQKLTLGRGEIVWNYRRDRYTQPEVSADDLLRVVVYEEYNLPKLPETLGWVGAYGTIIVGGAAMVLGLQKRNSGMNYYGVYCDVADPNDPAYLEISRDEHYNLSNDNIKPSQWLLGGGSALVLGGGLWLYDKFRMKKTYRRDFCMIGERMEWEPILAENSSSELGLRIWF